MSGRLVAAALAVALVGSATAPAALAQDKILLRFSTAASETDIRFKAFEIFADAVKDFATFEPHYSATLFAQGTEIPAIQRGNLEMAMPNPGEIAQQVPAWSIFAAGYLIRDPDHLIKVFDSDVGREMFALAEEALGVKVLGVMYAGTRQLNLKGNRRIATPADLAGITLRMPGTDAWQFLGRALGANPTPMAFTEVYTGLQTGAIDGQDNSLAVTRDAKFHEVTDQIILTSHYVGLDVFVIGRHAWDRFTPEQQEIVARAGRATVDEFKRIVTEAERDLVAFFQGEGLEVYTPDLDAFRTHVQKAYLESPYAATWPAGMVERINAIE